MRRRTILITTDQFRGEPRDGEIRQVVPFFDERPASILIGLPRMRDLGSFDQYRITPDSRAIGLFEKMPRSAILHGDNGYDSDAIRLQDRGGGFSD